MSKLRSKLGCEYVGGHFGAWYPDACCIDGYLWDLDSCDEPGGGLSHGGDIPCPKCNTREYVEYAGEIPISGNSRQRRIAKRKSIKVIQTAIARLEGGDA